MDSADILSWSPVYWEANHEACLQCLAEEKNWESIPLLNSVPLHSLVDQQLVRFQGMIQDMYDPEYFLEKYEVLDTSTGQSTVRSAKYRDLVICKDQEQLVEDSTHIVNSERQTWYCISTPALNKWALASKSSFPPGSTTSVPRETSPQSVKRSASEVEMESSPSEEETKRVCGGLPEQTPERARPPPQYNLNLPLPDPDARACLIKVYNEETDKYALNDVLEVVGFISLDPALGCDVSEGDEDAMDIEAQAHNPPTSLVPRLHAVAIRKLQHCNPLVTKNLNADEVLESADSVRKDLRLVLSQLLMGDDLAADYLICHLISSIYLRTELMALGQMSLNLSNIPGDHSFATKLYSILELLVPKSHYLPMTLEKLNSESFIPKKDYVSNQLRSGILQLSNHTHLILDETELQPGQLQNTGVHNMSALERLISQQKLSYEFQYYQLDFDYDIPVLVLSEGKSLLPCSVVVPLETDPSCVDTLEETLQAIRHFLQASLLDRIRTYLTVVRSSNYDMSPQLQKVIQDDFVALRQDRQTKKTSAEDLHNLIVLARLLSLSKGQTSLTETTWKRALAMEQERRQRLASITSARR
ncbi:mini-chromosome maintenance complex-binding protein isoform X3 [Anabrus simplex]|uniref:mini-chromosome maintenance complex-binding protein isoform X3 n=1 Tax=Anabrus simplex TaxID=316456 RepID=UPI0035A38664